MILQSLLNEWENIQKGMLWRRLRKRGIQKLFYTAQSIWYKKYEQDNLKGTRRNNFFHILYQTLIQIILSIIFIALNLAINCPNW